MGGLFALDHCAFCGREIGLGEAQLGGLYLGGPPPVHRHCALGGLHLLSMPDANGAQAFQWTPGHPLPCSICGGHMLTGERLAWPLGDGQGMPDHHEACAAPVTDV